MTGASIEKSRSKQPLHNHAFQVTTIVTFHTSNRSKSMILNMVYNLDSRSWAEFCCKMWGGQYDVKPI